MENEKKPVSFAIASKPRPPSRLSCLAAGDEDDATVAPLSARLAMQYVTEFDPSQTLPAANPAAAPRVIAPLPNRGPADTPPQTATQAPGGDLILRRYKEDVAALPDHGGMDEYRAVPVEGFGAALLAGYGWSEGKGIGRNNKNGDTEVADFGRRRVAGTQGLGYNPSQADPIMKS